MLTSPLAILLLQIIVVVVRAKVLGWSFTQLRQPAVIGEMLAGLLLGPSLLGYFSPAALAFLFPASSLDALQLLSQLGVVLFMFFVGLERDLAHLRSQWRTALSVSTLSIAMPFVLGLALAAYVYQSLAQAPTSLHVFALLMGTALSITAFPVLARILTERKHTHTALGQTVIACAAVGDVAAWALLAVVVAIAQASSLWLAAGTIALTLAFVGAMLLLRPYVERLFATASQQPERKNALIYAVLLFVFVSALITEQIGIHAIFGAFFAGAILPMHHAISRVLQERVETFASNFLMPLFFAFTGLRTDIGSLEGGSDWLLCALITAVAIVGKFGGSYIAACWAGQPKGSAAAIGILMNTRGLMEIIVLNVGYDLGVLSARAFTMMVIMALATTLMTGPCLNLLEKYSSVRLARRAAV